MLDLDDADLAARQFMALVSADLPNTSELGRELTDAELRKAATNAVRTFLRAYRVAASGPSASAAL
jgi:hypothetical protein